MALPPPALPPYVDGLIAGFQQGLVGRDVHLGCWHTLPGAAQLQAPQAWPAAQARLTDWLLALAGLADGQRVLDVGCGFGGTLQAVAARWQRMALLGLNIDARQLALCASLPPPPGQSLQWLQADACALPLAPASVDRVLCIEAMFHFGSRRRFYAEAARVLAPGGALVVADMLPQLLETDAGDRALAAALVDGFGPWPDIWGRDADHQALAAAAGLRCSRHIDATAHTLPSHVFTAAGPAPAEPIGRAAAALAQLHRGGRLHYGLWRFEKP